MAIKDSEAIPLLTHSYALRSVAKLNLELSGFVAGVYKFDPQSGDRS